MNHDDTYLAALEYILAKGKRKGDRTGTGTRSVFGMDMRFDLSKGFPLITTKKVHFKSIVYELLWFLRGDTNIQYLNDHGVTIWNEWADENGELGPVYGCQWRDWATDDENVRVDQIRNVVRDIKENPNSRRLIVSAWNPGELDQMALPPCHAFFQFYVWRNKLSCKLTQRSADFFLGVPFNIASYSLLIHMICHLTGLEPGELVWSGGDCHIYDNHRDQVEEQFTRVPYASPTLTIASDAPDDIDGGWKFDHFILENYEHHPSIKAPIAV